MQLNKEEYQRIFKKYLEGKASPEEIHFIEAYYESFELEENYTDGLQSEDRANLEESIKNRIEQNLSAFTSRPKQGIFRQWFRYAGVAILVLASFAAYHYFGDQPREAAGLKEGQITVKSQPKNNKQLQQPVLKLANGQVINLETGDVQEPIKESAGVTIVRNGKNELVYKNTQGNDAPTAASELYNEIQIPHGKQIKVVLPDGSRVWINAQSTLKYPIAFSGKERRVMLSGEAFFEVEKDKSRPFKVIANGSEVRVTGTHFNVSAYDNDDAVKTTLLEGSVSVLFNNDVQHLVPGEQAVSDLSRQTISKQRVDTEAEVAWKSGYFVFDQRMSDVIKIMSRWYDLDFKVASDVPNRTVAGRFSRSRDYKQILSYLGDLGGFDYSTNGKTVLLKRKY